MELAQTNTHVGTFGICFHLYSRGQRNHLRSALSSTQRNTASMAVNVQVLKKIRNPMELFSNLPLPQTPQIARLLPRGETISLPSAQSYSNQHSHLLKAHVWQMLVELKFNTQLPTLSFRVPLPAQRCFKKSALFTNEVSEYRMLNNSPTLSRTPPKDTIQTRPESKVGNTLLFRSYIQSDFKTVSHQL